MSLGPALSADTTWPATDAPVEVYDERGVWWGDFESHAEALHYATHPVERLEEWLRGTLNA